MIQIEIPGHGILNLEVLVLDYNGTLALDGKLLPAVKDKLIELSQHLELHIITADTFGTVVSSCSCLPVTVKVLQSGNHTEEKADYLSGFGNRQVVAVGNGANDQMMLRQADVGIVVIGPEGCSAKCILGADVIVQKITDAFDLLLNPKRLAATLRA